MWMLILLLTIRVDLKVVFLSKNPLRLKKKVLNHHSFNVKILEIKYIYTWSSKLCILNKCNMVVDCSIDLKSRIAKFGAEIGNKYADMSKE